jgi:hypothetical protein
VRAARVLRGVFHDWHGPLMFEGWVMTVPANAPTITRMMPPHANDP